jgi:transposase-like protein
MGNWKTYSPQLKAETVLEAIRGQKSTAQICKEYSISEDLLSEWKREFLANSPLLFTIEKAESQEQERIEELEGLVDRLSHKLRVSRRAITFIMQLLLAYREADSTIVQKGKRRSSDKG